MFGNEDQIDLIDVNQNADCDSRAAALGFSLTANDPADNAEDSRPDNAPKATVNDPSTNGDETAAAKGLCGITAPSRASYSWLQPLRCRQSPLRLRLGTHSTGTC